MQKDVSGAELSPKQIFELLVKSHGGCGGMGYAELEIPGIDKKREEEIISYFEEHLTDGGVMGSGHDTYNGNFYIHLGWPRPDAPPAGTPIYGFGLKYRKPPYGYVKPRKEVAK